MLGPPRSPVAFKTLIFPRVFQCFEKCAFFAYVSMLCLKLRRRGLILGPLGAILGPSCALWGASWRTLGPPWGHPGAILAHLWAFLGHLGPTLGLSAATRSYLEPSLPHLWLTWSLGKAILGPSGRLPDPFGAHLGHMLEPFCSYFGIYRLLSWANAYTPIRIVVSKPINTKTSLTLEASSPRGASAGTRSANNSARNSAS